jgi:LysM repeat protein
MDESGSQDLVSVRSYTVKGSETLATVARRLHISRSDLAEANGLGATARISAGQELTVPADVPFVPYSDPQKPKPVAKTSSKKAGVASARKTASN